jgi:serine/threonine-protein kinase RsbW
MLEMAPLMTQNKSNKTARKNEFIVNFRSRKEEIARVENAVNRIRKIVSLDDGLMYRLLVCCTEAVNNAIIHGNRSDPKKKVTLRCTVGKRTLTICVSDEGKGFDPDTLKDPRKDENLLKENGRGVFLMRSLMDKIAFKRTKKGYAVEMKVKLNR